MSISFTISNLDDETFRRLQAEAQRTGSDPESVAKSVLANGLSTDAAAVGSVIGEQKASKISPGAVPHHDLDYLAGTWTEEEAKQFLEAIADCRRIDLDEWQ
jgi:plasmid stability protein